MERPICDFVRGYAGQDALRLHMPGHKGVGPLGVEALDITEIPGADSLYEAKGIIRSSEENASGIFGCPTLYSAEGSSLCIRAMLYLSMLHAKEQGKAPLIAAGRNAHKTFLTAAVLLGFDVQWLYPPEFSSYLSCVLDAQTLDAQLSAMEQTPTAVYLTSPDYLGNTVDLQAISQVVHRHGCLLLVDNAHGAYLKFLPRSEHPIDLGADLCCDSAHKTLPVLTGGAYLHISPDAPALFRERAKDGLALFGSTSPSYLIMQSLDAVNPYLETDYPRVLADFLPAVDGLKNALAEHGYVLVGDEPLKLTLCAKPYGYTGKEFDAILLSRGVVGEFADPDFVVLMLTPEIGADGLKKLESVLTAIPRKEAILTQPPAIHKSRQVMPIREAAFSSVETVSVSQALGRIYAGTNVGCPPAVPPVVCGERIDENTLEQFAYYGMETCPVITRL